MADPTRLRSLIARRLSDQTPSEEAAGAILSDDGVAGSQLSVLYVCRAIDETSPFTAAQTEWVSTLARHPDVVHVHVLTPRVGPASLPDNVTVQRFSRRPWIRLVPSFLWAVARAGPRRFDFFFVAQGGPFPALLLPFKLLTRRPIYHWKAQPHVSRRMRFYARWCDDLVFTATEGSLSWESGRKRVIGHGIDTELFSPANAYPDRDFVTVGRLSPIKHIDLMIRAIAACGRVHGTTPTLDVIGRLAEDREYVDQLRALIREHDLEDSVRLLGHVDYHMLPQLLPRYRATLNFSSTALDKSVGESMACAVPVVTTNSCAAEILPPDLRPHLVVDATDLAAQAAALQRVMDWDGQTRAVIGHRLRTAIVDEHSLTTLFGRILHEIAIHRTPLG